MTTTLFTLFTLLGCGSEARTTPTETTAGQAVDESPAEAPAQVEPAESGLTVTRISGSESAPATAYEGPPTNVTARVQDGALLVSIANFVYYCEPFPTFTARMDGEVLVLQAEPPTGLTTRCIGPHSSELRIEGVPAGEHAVSLRNTSGEQVATTD